MKRSLLPLALILLFCSLPVSAKDKWLKIKSKHFTLVGNASERDIRTVGTKLEQFRSVFSQLFPRVRVDSSVPIVVIVFKSKSSYVPFMPGYNGKVTEVAGYFQPGEDVNYITLTSEFGQTNPYSTIFHEFVHSLTNDTTANMPLWFTEGIAEFYEMFDVTDKDTKVTLGAPISHHVYRLRETKFMPFPQFFAVHHKSPEYNERDKQSIFYAQAWAFIHYVMLGNNGQRQPQLGQFVNLLNTGAPVEECFTKAFQTDFVTMEKELKNYISRNTYPVLRFTSKTKLTFDDEMTMEPMEEAEANYHLGDLLAHQRRTDAEKYLQTAIQLDPTFAPAHASLGLIRIYTGQMEDAQKYLEKAVTYDKAGRNHLIYYYYAMALMRTGASVGGVHVLSSDFDPKRAQLIRTNLKRAIQINPGFGRSYSLLSFVNLVTGEEIDETVALLKRAWQAAPGDQDLAFQLAQLYLRQQKFDDAKKIVEPIARTAADPARKQRAQNLLDQLTQIAEQTARLKEFDRDKDGNLIGKVEQQDGQTRIRPTLRRRNEGEEIKGLLTKMDCSEKGLTLHITAGNEKLVFHTARPDRLEFITFTQSVGESIECKEFKPAKPVRVIYRGNTDASSKYNGEPLMVEFIKPEEK
ncbi:MAG TPA: tetratricopeptide repeat protein [Blastocatellia bacterium]|nr:tetratricopeptide repeat protein [Blastocatellia bacterium]